MRFPPFKTFHVFSACCVVIIVFLVFNPKNSVFRNISQTICTKKLTLSDILKRQGRRHVDYPSPVCCTGITCLSKDLGRYAVLTTLRSDDYIEYLINFQCTLHRSNPSIELIVATVKGDLSDDIIKKVQSLGKNVRLLYWDEYKFQNYLRSSYSLNWVKIRAWDMTDYDAILMIDSDTVILDDISYIFKLPAHIAVILDEDKTESVYQSLGTMQGGVVFLRPCPAISQHMMTLLDSRPSLRFEKNHAEQDFFDWYFRYDRMVLPGKFNSIRHLLDDRMLTRSGDKPVIVHQTRKGSKYQYKLFDIERSCSLK